MFDETLAATIAQARRHALVTCYAAAPSGHRDKTAMATGQDRHGDSTAFFVFLMLSVWVVAKYTRWWNPWAAARVAAFGRGAGPGRPLHDRLKKAITSDRLCGREPRWAISVVIEASGVVGLATTELWLEAMPDADDQAR